MTLPHIAAHPCPPCSMFHAPYVLQAHTVAAYPAQRFEEPKPTGRQKLGLQGGVQKLRVDYAVAACPARASTDCHARTCHAQQAHLPLNCKVLHIHKAARHPSLFAAQFSTVPQVVDFGLSTWLGFEGREDSSAEVGQRGLFGAAAATRTREACM